MGTHVYLTAGAVVDRLTVDGIVTAADQSARTITGRAVLWGEIGHTSAGPARFAAGSLAVTDPSRVKLLVEHDPNRVVGYGVSITPDADGINATFHVADGPVGDEVLASAAGRYRDGLSVGVQIDAANLAADGVLDVTTGRLRETSVVALPAMPSSVITHVAASTPPPATPAGGGHWPVPAAPRVPVAPAMVQGNARVDVNAAFERMAVAYRNNGGEGLIRAALADVVPPTTPGEQDLWARPAWLGEVWQARNAGRRPLIDSVQRKPLTTLRVNGFQRQYPIAGVAEYAGLKGPVPSTGTFKLLPVTADAKRIAGAHDIDRALIDLGGFGDASFIAAYFEAQTDNYLELTESLFAAELLAGATDFDTTPGASTADNVVDVLVGLAAYLGSIGANCDWVKVSSDLFMSTMAITNQAAPWLFGGSANIQNGTATIGGMSISAEPSLPPATVLAGDKRAATFFEWSPAPLRVQAVNIPNGGVDLGVFGYWASLINDPRAIVSVTVATPPPLDAPAGRKTKNGE